MTPPRPDPRHPAGTAAREDLVLVPAAGGASILYAFDGEHVSELGTFADPDAARAALDALDRPAA